MSTFTIDAELKVQFRISGMPEDEHETAYPKVLITYTYTRGCPARGPSYSSGGEPAEPDEVELVSVELIDGDGLDPTKKQLEEWAEEWLWAEGYDRSCRNAVESISESRADYEMQRDSDDGRGP